MIEIIKFNRSKFEKASRECPFYSPMFVTHERLLLEPYQTWQYCEVADIEPFQGQSDQIFQFSSYPESRPNPILRANWKGTGGDHDSFSFPLTKPANRERESPPFPLVLPIEARWKRKEHARENIKRCANENAKTGIFGPDFPSDARHLGPVWPPVWINVTSRSRFFRLPFFLFIYLSISLALFHSFFYSRSLSPPLFPLLARFVPLVLSLPSLIRLTLSSHTVITIVFFLYIYIYNIYP